MVARGKDFEQFRAGEGGDCFVEGPRKKTDWAPLIIIATGQLAALAGRALIEEEIILCKGGSRRAADHSAAGCANILVDSVVV